tara:strand:- start:3599 stop:4276 length:678 start_codon:yes stop_codon:yes gene_type:complete
MKDEIKEFWANRANRHMWKGTLGKWQSTSLTKTEEAAADRRKAEVKYLKKALALIEGSTNMNLLDVGCGTGKLTLFLSENFKHVYATDYIEDFLNVAKESARGLKIKNITFKRRSANEPNDDIEFDCCALCGVLQYLTEEEYESTLEATKNAKFFIVKESVSIGERIELKNHYSEELESYYSAIYRTETQIIEDFKNLGYEMLMNELIIAHRKETNIKIFLFKKK